MSAKHTVHKIGGTSMLEYDAVRDNIVLDPATGGNPYQRILVVSAYGGITDQLLEHKKSGRPGVFGLFAAAQSDEGWRDELARLRARMYQLNGQFFKDAVGTERANRFVDERLDSAEACLDSLQQICNHGHFSLSEHLQTVREMLASVGEAQSAWNTAALSTSQAGKARNTWSWMNAFARRLPTSIWRPPCPLSPATRTVKPA